MDNPNFEIIIGPMFSGKSTELIRRVRIYKSINKKVLVIKPKIDNRYSVNKVSSHDKTEEDCIVISDLKKILENENNLLLFNDSDIVFIEEAQFFNNLKKFVLVCLEKFNKSVIVVGLDGDSNRNVFGEILELVPYCNKIVKLNSMCQVCKDGTLAPFTFKKTKSNEQIEVGGSELYFPLCRKHYLEYTNNVCEIINDA